jgi:hypothetical protein
MTEYGLDNTGSIPVLKDLFLFFPTCASAMKSVTSLPNRYKRTFLFRIKQAVNETVYSLSSDAEE